LPCEVSDFEIVANLKMGQFEDLKINEAMPFSIIKIAYGFLCHPFLAECSTMAKNPVLYTG
jgi:hypothetical protein